MYNVHCTCTLNRMHISSFSCMHLCNVTISSTIAFDKLFFLQREMDFVDANLLHSLARTASKRQHGLSKTVSGQFQVGRIDQQSGAHLSVYVLHLPFLPLSLSIIIFSGLLSFSSLSICPSISLTLSLTFQKHSPSLLLTFYYCLSLDRTHRSNTLLRFPSLYLTSSFPPSLSHTSSDIPLSPSNSHPPSLPPSFHSLPPSLPLTAVISDSTDGDSGKDESSLCSLHQVQQSQGSVSF